MDAVYVNQIEPIDGLFTFIVDSVFHYHHLPLPSQMYQEEEQGRLVYVSLSVDSTCVNQLRSPVDGYETLVMAREDEPQPNQLVSTSGYQEKLHTKRSDNPLVIQ